MTFSEDGNPDLIQEDPPIINFGKRELISKVVRDVLMHQTATCTIQEIEPVYTFVAQLPMFDEKELYELSTHREPRGAEQHEVEAREKNQERKQSF